MNSDKTEIEESGQQNTPPLPESKNQLTQLILDIGEQMLICGGEVNRVEETISRLCTAYGALRADVFSITSAIIVTVCWENGEIITQSRRICASGREFNRLEELNELSRYICRTRPAIEEVESRMRKIVCPAPARLAGHTRQFFGCWGMCRLFRRHLEGRVGDNDRSLCDICHRPVHL